MEAIHTANAPAALGPYSQAIRVGSIVYLSGQIGIDPESGTLKQGVEAQAHQVFHNLKVVAEAAGGNLGQIAKLTLLLMDIAHFGKINEIMALYFEPPFPARSTYQVAALPRDAQIEVEGILVLSPP